MRPKNYTYKAVDGNHWPDTPLGDGMYFSIDFDAWLVAQEDTLISVTWILPEGMDGEDAHEDGNEAYIKLTPSKRGSFTIKCSAITEEEGKQQTKLVPMVLKVY